jgi:hypothetical protein
MVPPVVLVVVSTSGTLGVHLDHFRDRAGGKLGVGARRRTHAHRNLVSVVVRKPSFSTVTL